MKTFFIILVMVILQNYAKADAQWTTKGLDDVETQVIDEASDKEIKELSSCMNDYSETQINNTSCVNEVFGDVHN